MSFENPGTAFLALHLTVEELLDHLAMRAEKRFHRKLLQERECALLGAVRRKRISTLELESERLRKWTNCFDAAHMRARDDPLDRKARERLPQMASLNASHSVQRALAIEPRR